MKKALSGMALETIQSETQQFQLENSEIKLVVRPDLGGRIDQLQDCKTGREWLWHPPQYHSHQSRSLPIGASFDGNWTGGWDEIFPNDAAGAFQGRDLVDHGELWSQAWQVVAASQFGLQLAYTCQTVPVAVEKTICLSPTEPTVEIEYRFQNLSTETIPFLFKQHAAIAIQEGDEILLPTCLIEPVDLGFSKMIGQQQKTCFPKAFAANGELIDLQRVPGRSSQLQEFYYSSNLAVGECGIRSGCADGTVHSPASLLMKFDTADFPYVWVFQSYGGWQNHYVVVLEPCTTMPYDLDVACRNGTAAQLPPQAVQHRKLTVHLQRS